MRKQDGICGRGGVRMAVNHNESTKVHHVHFYGMMSDEQKQILKEIERVTEKSEWEGISGVYCIGSVKVEGRDMLGVYVGQFNEQLPEEKRKFEFDVNDIHYTVSKCPVIFIDSIQNKEPHQFAFIILHELGHHVDRIKNGITLKQGVKRYEMFADQYALERLSKIKEMDSRPLMRSCLKGDSQIVVVSNKIK
jgi:hypothetical protein